MKRTMLIVMVAALSAAAAGRVAAQAAEGGARFVEVAFVLDSTGSMEELIEGAKQKIWSIANSIIALKPSPQVRFGLVSYRDRGDEYVTRLFDLSDDVDAVFAALQSLRADGGGDTPESVNQALFEAVHRMSWSKDRRTLKIIFLVGDCPPHMDYRNDVKYMETCAEAVRLDLIINTVQCGDYGETRQVWQDIARRAEGSYVALAQSGNMTVVETPFDEQIARYSRELSATVIAYGAREQQEASRRKLAEAAEAPASTAADRAAFNLASGGKAIQGTGDLVADLEARQVDLAGLKTEELPKEMQAMSPAERKAHVARKQVERTALNARLAELARQRSEYLEKEIKRAAASGRGDAFDAKVAEIIAAQAARRGR